MVARPGYMIGVIAGIGLFVVLLAYRFFYAGVDEDPTINAVRQHSESTFDPIDDEIVNRDALPATDTFNVGDAQPAGPSIADDVSFSDAGPLTPGGTTGRPSTPNTGRVLRSDDHLYEIYSLKKNDTFESIALERFGSKALWQHIANANPLTDPMKLKIGAEIRIPKSIEPTAEAVPAPSTEIELPPEQSLPAANTSDPRSGLIASRPGPQMTETERSLARRDAQRLVDELQGPRRRLERLTQVGRQTKLRTKSGDTLYDIAAIAYNGRGHLWPHIFEANQSVLTDPGLVPPNVELTIPAVPFPNERQVSGDSRTASATVDLTVDERNSVLVREGDTLSGIAKRVYGKASLWRAVYEANRDVLPTANDLVVGIRLQLPDTIAAASATSNVTMAAASGGRSATVAEVKVKSGDTLFDIAARHYGTGTEWKQIYEANRDVLSAPNRLKVGQTLRVPSLDGLLAFSGNNGSGDRRGVQAAAVELKALADTNRGVVVVEEGESLSGIARRVYGDAARWARIYNANRDVLPDPRSLKPGMLLFVPDPIGTATLASTNTQSRSASSASLMKIAPSSSGEYYVVQSGDTLYGISKRMYQSGILWKRIYDANRDVIKAPDVLRPGTRLHIPAASPRIAERRRSTQPQR